MEKIVLWNYRRSELGRFRQKKGENVYPQLKIKFGNYFIKTKKKVGLLFKIMTVDVFFQKG